MINKKKLNYETNNSINDNSNSNSISNSNSNTKIKLSLKEEIKKTKLSNQDLFNNNIELDKLKQRFFAGEYDRDVLKLDNQLCFLIYAASRAMTNAYRPLLKSLDLTYPQYLVMLLLWEKEELSLKEIGEKLYLDSGTLTPLLKRLESAGCLQRRRFEQDERVILLKLTQKGRELKELAFTIPRDLFCKSGLSMQEFLDLRSIMSRLIKEFRSETL